MSRSRRRKKILLVALLVLFINLPILHSTWTQWRVDRSGTDVTATVVDSEVLGTDKEPSYWLAFTFPKEIDPGQQHWTAEVDEATYDEATASRTLQARVLDDRPAAYRVEGNVRHWFGLLTTVVADVVLLLIVLLLWRFGGRSRPLPIRISAIGDLERCPPGVGVLERIEGTLYLVRGEVSEIDDEEVVLDLGDRDVIIVLDGHHNPVDHQQPAQVRGRILD